MLSMHVRKTNKIGVPSLNLQKIDAGDNLMIRLVPTDMGTRAAQFNGLEKALVTVEGIVRGIKNQV